MKMCKLGTIVSLAFCIFAVHQNASADLAAGMAEFRKGNFDVAVKEITQEAESGNAEAQVFLGGIYTYGTGVSQDTAKAFTWYQQAANQGDSSGQELLGRAYLNGQGVTKDAKAAFKSFLAAAPGGNREAQYQVALMLNQGEGVPQSYSQAHKWLRQLADIHHGLALNDLGLAYQNGLGVTADKVLAFALYNTSSLFGASPQNKAGVNRAALSNDMADIEIENGLTLSCTLNKANKLTVQLDDYIANPKKVLDSACVH